MCGFVAMALMLQGNKSKEKKKEWYLAQYA
jgi:hypothetical protein